jgi:hypothetical protein
MGLLPLSACVIFARGRHGDRCLCLKQLHISIIDTSQVLQHHIVSFSELDDMLGVVFIANTLLL